MPREAHLSFVVFGEGAIASPTSGGTPLATAGSISGSNAQLGESRCALGSAITPLFDHDGYLIQGPLMLSVDPVHDGKLSPWGARSLIVPSSAGTAAILYVRFVEYDYKIEFPRTLLASKP